MAVKPATKKGSVSTETVLGQAAQQIAKAITELNNATTTVTQLVTKADELSLLVANKEEQIQELQVQYQEKARQAQVEFDLNVKAHAEHVVTQWLTANGKVAVDSTELTDLENELATTKANADAETKRQVASAVASVKSQYENDIKLLHSENKAISVENATKITALVEKNKFLEDQMTKVYGQLDAERTASVERARASSVGSINLTAAK
jgi:hypothetical protein